MSTSKHIDALCAVVTVLTVLLALLCMNGQALGVQPLADGDGGTGQFTANDLDGAWDASGATRIDLTAGTVAGNGAYMVDGDVHIVYAGKYVLTGTLADGSVIVEADGDDKIWLLLDGADLRCSDGAALRVEQAEKVFLTLAEGTENAVSDGTTYAETAASDGVDGAIYARDDLTINGAGSLTVTGAYCHGVVCNDDLVLAGGTIAVTAVQDGLHANDSTRIANAALTITAGDDGVTVSNDQGTGYFYMGSGSVTIPSCREGIEAVSVTVDGGTLDITPTDDGINASGGADPAITVNGGEVRVVCPQGRDADGLDSNGDIYLNGGRVFVSMDGSGGSFAIDYGSESGGVCRVDGGTLVACGGSAMVESLDASSGQGFVQCAVSGTAGASLILADENGEELLSETIPCPFSYVMVSAPGMTAGSAYALSVDGVETQVTANDISGASGGFGGFGGMGGGGMRMGGGRGTFQGQEQMGTADQLPQLPQAGTGMGEGTMEPPTMPEDMEPPTMQEGQELPTMPEDMGPFAMQEGTDAPAAPEGQDQTAQPEEQDQTQLWGARGQRQGAFGPLGEMDQAAPDGTGTEPALSAEALILLGASVAVLLAGILFAARCRH